MAHPPSSATLTREWLVAQPNLYSALADFVGVFLIQQNRNTIEEALQKLPEGIRWFYYASEYFRVVNADGTAAFFRNSIVGDPSGRRIESTYIALSRLGLLQFAQLLAKGAAPCIHIGTKSVEKLLRGLIADAGFQAPSRKQAPLSEEQITKACQKIDAQLRTLSLTWIAHIERFIRSNPRVFVSV